MAKTITYTVTNDATGYYNLARLIRKNDGTTLTNETARFDGYTYYPDTWTHDFSSCDATVDKVNGTITLDYGVGTPEIYDISSTTFPTAQLYSSNSNVTITDAPEIVSQTTALTGLTLSSDSPVVGSVLTTTIAPSGATATYQWYSDDGGDGPYDALSGCTSSSYTPDAYRIGCHLRCVATGSGDYTGTATATTTNTTTTPITGVTLSSDSPVVGTEITATIAPSGATATYQWYSDDAGDGIYDPLSGCTATTYTPDATRTGCHIRCIATGNGSYSGTATATSTNTVTVATTPLTSLTLSTDNPVVGTAIMATPTPSSATATYQWSYESNSVWTDIAEATSATYIPTSLVANCLIKCTATGTGDYASSPVSVTSASDVDIALEAPAITVTTTGTTTVDLTGLTVTGASTYDIQYDTVGTFVSATNIAAITANEGSYTVTGLIPATTYYFRAKAN